MHGEDLGILQGYWTFCELSVFEFRLVARKVAHEKKMFLDIEIKMRSFWDEILLALRQHPLE